MSKNAARDLAALLREHVNQLVEIVTAAVRRNLADEIADFLSTPAGAGRRGPKRILPCIAPGCKNPSKGPRFRYLCDEHKGARKSDVEAWRAARKAGTGAARGRSKPAAA